MASAPGLSDERLAPALAEMIGFGLVFLPSLALAYTVILHSFSNLLRFAKQARALSNGTSIRNGSESPAGSEKSAYLVIGKRQLAVTLQFLVGSLVTFGGAAFTLLTVNSFGTALGLGHLSIGLAGLSVGILAARRKVLPIRVLLVTNVVTIAYSLLSVSIAAFQSLLPTAALHDSLIGTAIAIAMSGALVYLSRR